MFGTQWSVRKKIVLGLAAFVLLPVVTGLHIYFGN